MTSSTGAGWTIPWPFVAMPVTVTRLSSSATTFPMAVIVTVPSLSISPAGIVSLTPFWRKSPSSASPTGLEETSIVVTALDGRSRVAVTAASPPSSGIEAGPSTNVTTGSGSSSTIVISMPPAGPTVRPEVVVALTSRVLSGSSVPSSTGIRSNSADPSVSPAEMVRTRSATAV